VFKGLSRLWEKWLEISNSILLVRVRKWLSLASLQAARLQAQEPCISTPEVRRISSLSSLE
jgi:hypothetical protein